jgi:cytochrome c
MKFLQLIAIPHSEATLKLLEFLFFIGFSVFEIYLAIVFGSLFNSIYYAFKGRRLSNTIYFKHSFDFANQSGKGIIPPLFLGLVPLLAVFFILIQFQLPNMLKLQVWFFISLLTYLCAFISFQFYKRGLLKNLSSIEGDLSSRKVGTVPFVPAFISIILVAITVWITIAIFAQFLETSARFSIATFLFSSEVILRVVLFIIAGLLFSSLGYAFFKFSADKLSKNGDLIGESAFTKKVVARALIFGLFFPFALFILYLITPISSVSFQYYVLVIVSILILLLALTFAYFAFKEFNIRFARIAFYISIVSYLLFFGSETTLFAVSNKILEFQIVKAYQIYEENLLASAGRTVREINGEEIYKSKCVACHQFDTKLVGPPHKEVLKKYENRKEDMVKFILNPIKVDPNYPPMPNQGLKPKEAEAVVKYMFEHYGPMLK